MKLLILSCILFASALAQTDGGSHDHFTDGNTDNMVQFSLSDGCLPNVDRFDIMTQIAFGSSGMFRVARAIEDVNGQMWVKVPLASPGVEPMDTLPERVVEFMRTYCTDDDYTVDDVSTYFSELLPEVNTPSSCVPPNCMPCNTAEARKQTRAKLSRRNLQTLPDTLDHTEMTAPIRDQGNMGSCSSFAAATVKTYHERLDSGDMTYQMSPLFVYSFRSSVPAGGMTSSETALILENYGDCFEDTLPYDDSQDSAYLEGSTLSDDIMEEAAGYKILQRIQWTPWVGRNQDLDEFKHTCMENLNAYGPAWFAVTVYNYGCELYKGTMPQGGHAMALVGYDADGMIFQNSWGMWCGTPGPGLSHIPWQDAKDYIDEINWYEDDLSVIQPTEAPTVAGFKHPTEYPTPTPPEACFDVVMSAQRYANEISWTIGDDLCTSSETYSNFAEITETCCIQGSNTLPATLDLYCEDSYGDGWHGAYVTILGATYCEAFESGSVMQTIIYTDGNVPAPTCKHADSGGACGDISGELTTCPAGESCSMFGTCGTTMIHTRTAQTDFSDGNCPAASAKFSLNTFSIVGGETSNIVNLFALIGLLSVFYYISTTISNQFKSYERIDMVCESEI